MESDNIDMLNKKPGELLREYQTGEQTFSMPQVDLPDDTPSFAPYLTARMPSSVVVEDNTQEAIQSGYGLEKHDSGYLPGWDLEQQRAVEQSGLSKVINGAFKGGVTAVTTAVNTVAGTLWGAAVGAYNLAENLINGEEQPLRNAVDSGVNNAVSTAMMNIQKKSEELFPNYRTEEERTDEYQKEWIKHVFTPNFIGDSFLKNFGFTVGAMAGAMAWNKALSAISRPKLANNLMKGVTAAAAGDAEANAALTEAVNAVRAGRASEVQLDLLKNNIKNASKRLRFQNEAQKYIGATIGAMGEGVTEGVMARNEFMKSFDADWQRALNEEYSNAANDVLTSGNSNWVNEIEYIMPDGTTINDNIITDAGKREIEKRQRGIITKYQKEHEFAEQQADRLASTTFALNIPILTLSNTIQFGRLLSGGWKTAKSATRAAVKGTIARDATGKVVADVAGRGNAILGTMLNVAKMGGTEAAEEMLQGFVSSGSKNVADARLTAFHDDGFDSGAVRDYGSWVSKMMEGGGEYLGDWTNWQEGFMGLVTGLLGIPVRGYFRGQRGGIPQAIAEGGRAIGESKRLADIINNRVNSKEFQEQWYGYARHNKYEREMADALKNNDEYTWHTANDKQLISDIMMFADAGRLDELTDLVDTYSSMSQQEAINAGIIEAAKSKETAQDIDNNPQRTLDSVKKHAEEFKNTIKDFKNVYDELSVIVPPTTSDEHLKELVFTALQTKKFEQRYFNVLDDVLNGIEPIIKRNITSTTNDSEIRQILKNKLTRYSDTFAGLTLPTESDPTKAYTPEETKAIKWLEEKVKDDAELSKKVDDLKKLSESRKAFFSKFGKLKNISSEAFATQAKHMATEGQAARSEAAHEELKSLTSLNAVKQEYFSRDAKGRADYMDVLSSSTPGDNQFVDTFIAMKNRHKGFEGYIAEHPIVSPDITVTPIMIQSAVNDILRRAQSEDDIINLPDSVFIPQDQFNLQNQSPFGPTSPTAYESVKLAIRESMNSYMGVNSATASRETMNPVAAPPQQPQGTVSSPTGRDASQPGSLAPAPQPKVAAEKESPEAKLIRETFQGVAEGLKEALNSNPKIHADFVKRVSDWLDTPQVASAFSEYGKGAETVEKLVENAKKDNPDWPSYMVKSLDEALNTDELRTKLQTFLGNEPKPAANDERVQYISPDAIISVHQPTTTDILDDEIDSVQDDVDESVEKETARIEGQKSKIAYYRTSVPEVDSGEASKARDAIKNKDREALLNADLSDFVKKHPEYATIWNALQQAGAFDAVNTSVEVSDEVEFAIDPAFPEYNGKPQILVRRKSDGQILTVLSTQSSKYYGLQELREIIESEFEKFKQTNPNDVYVFEKTSKVWAKRPGLIDYDFSGVEQSIANIPGYSETAPIVYINRRGNAIKVAGTTNSDVVNQVSDTFNDPDYNTENGKIGNLYYLVKTDKDKYAPVRLNVEHFREENKDISNPIFDNIRERIEAIADTVKEASVFTPETSLEQQNEKLHKELKDLSEYLDITGLYFELGNYNNVGIALRVNDGTDSVLRRPEQISAAWLTNYLASFGRSIQIRQDTKGQINNLDEYLNSGILTSNARMLRPKGSDFYFNPWSPDTQDFKPITQSQAEVDRTFRTSETTTVIAEEPIGPDEFGDRDDFGMDDESEPAFGENKAEMDEVRIWSYISANKTIKASDLIKRFDVKASEISDYLNYLELTGRIRHTSNPGEFQVINNEVPFTRFVSLEPSWQKAIQEKGYTQEEYDNLPDELKQKVLDCIDVF